MKFIYWISVIALFFIFYSCASQPTVIKKNYENQNLINQSLSIVKLFDRPNIANYDDVNDDLGAGVPEEVYMKYFKKKFVDDLLLHCFINKAVFIDSVSRTSLNKKVLDVSNNMKIIAYLPSEKTELKKIKTDFTLFLYNLNVSRISGSSGSFVNGTMSGGSFGKLYHQLDFALWDNNKGRIVSYGRIDDKSSIVFGMGENNWASVIKGLATKIILLSPFKPKF